MQPLAGKKAWQQWSDMMQWLYAKPNYTLLDQHPLGLWLPCHANNFNWNWQICPNTHTKSTTKPQPIVTATPIIHEHQPDTLPHHTAKLSYQSRYQAPSDTIPCQWLDQSQPITGILPHLEAPCSK